MKEGIILYKSKYGAAKKYAGWLQENTHFECMEISKADISEVMQYETVILCGGIYASGIAGLSFLKKNMGRLRNKKTAILCVGASPYDEKAIAEIKAHNLTGDLKNIPIFYGRGTWDEKRMRFMDRALSRMLHRLIAKKDPATYEPWMEALMCAYGKSCDWTDKKYIYPLLNHLGKRLPLETE